LPCVAGILIDRVALDNEERDAVDRLVAKKFVSVFLDLLARQIFVGELDRKSVV